MGNYKSDKKNCLFIGLKLSRNTDSDIIEYLGQQPNVQGYIKQLIRTDISAHIIQEGNSEKQKEDPSMKRDYT